MNKKLLKKLLKIILIVFVLINLVFGIIFAINPQKAEILSPLSWRTPNKKRVIGFLPSWMINKDVYIAPELDELIFLGVEVEEDGNLSKNDLKIIQGEGFKSIKSEVKSKRKKLTLGIKLFDDNKLDSLFSNMENIDRLAENIYSVVKKEGFDGVNLDMEYQLDPIAILRPQYFELIQKLNQLKVGYISVDLFCNTIIKGEKQALQNLFDQVDWVIAMGYDFHYPGVNYTGSVAPIDGRVGERSIRETANTLLNLDIEKNKAIIAFPLYGYEWKTETEDYGSKIIRGWYQMASFSRIKQILDSDQYQVFDNQKQDCLDLPKLEENQLRLCWDEISKTPWIVFKQQKELRQIHYDDLSSLKIKINLVNESNLGGWGYWAMGYEGTNREVWEIDN